MSRLFTVGGSHTVVFPWVNAAMNSEEFTYLSLARWDNLNNIPSLFSRVVSGGLDAPVVQVFDRGSGPRLEWTVVAGVFAIATEATAIPTGQWLFHAFTFSRSKGSRIFRAKASGSSGVREVNYSSNVKPTNTVYAPATSTLTIGQSDESTFFTFGGAQKLLWYFTRELPMGEIQELKNQLCSGRRPRWRSLAVAVDLDVTLAGGTVADFGGASGGTGTITGTSLTVDPPRMRHFPKFTARRYGFVPGAAPGGVGHGLTKSVLLGRRRLVS